MVNKLKVYIKRIFFPKLKKEKAIRTLPNPPFHGNNHVHNYSIGLHSYVSFNSIIYNCKIGNYCSIGPNVVIGYGDHPLTLITTSPFIYLNNKILSQKEIELILKDHFNQVIIKNDVWIGANVYIKNGVTVGNGAVIGAGSVVTKDVGDYDIVVGTPARSIRKRFVPEIIELLLKIEWWNLDENFLTNYKNVILKPDVDNLSEMLTEITSHK